MWFFKIKTSLLFLLSAGAISPLLAAVAPIPAADDLITRVGEAPARIDAQLVPSIEARKTTDGASAFRGLRRRGIAASQARLLLLTARKSDLELQMQLITQSRTQLANQRAALEQLLGVLRGQPGTEAQIATIEQQISAIQEIDKQLDLEMKRIDVQRQAVDTEIEAVQKVIQKNIESGFKIIG